MVYGKNSVVGKTLPAKPFQFGLIGAHILKYMYYIYPLRRTLGIIRIPHCKTYDFSFDHGLNLDSMLCIE